MKANKSTVSIPLASKNYEISMRQKEITRPNGTDIVCIGTLCRNGKPVAAVAPKQRTVHTMRRTSQLLSPKSPTILNKIFVSFSRGVVLKKKLQPPLSKALCWRASAASAIAES